MASCSRTEFKKRPVESSRTSSTDDLSYKDVHCTLCQRRGRRTKGEYYCQDCKVGLCTACANNHLDDVKINRHSVSIISKTFQVSPNQGPFPELTEIGTIKFEAACCIKGSAFLPNGELAATDFTNSKVLVFSADYTRKKISQLLIPKQTKGDTYRPKPLDVTACGSRRVAFTANNGYVYVASIGTSMLLTVDRVIPVINFESNYGECLGIAYNDVEGKIYVGCSSDREGYYINVYDLDGILCRVARENIISVPDYLTFGLNKSKLYAADSDDVRVYDVTDFRVVEDYTELEAKTKGIIVDKWGYLYTLALERRTFKTPGSIYRLAPSSGVTKVTSVNDKPTSMAYCMGSDDVAVTFENSRYIYLYKLKLRSFQKQFGNDLKPYRH